MTTERPRYEQGDGEVSKADAPSPSGSTFDEAPVGDRPSGVDDPTIRDLPPEFAIESIDGVLPPDPVIDEPAVPPRSRIGNAPDRITVQPRAWSPARIHVRAGDIVYEGDPRRLRRIGGRTPRIDAWEVVEITPHRVTAKHVDSDIEFDWDRAALETGLLTGRYAVDLVEFVSVGVRRNVQSRSRPETVIATAYGNNGLRYVRRYIIVGGGLSVKLERWTETPAVSGLPEQLARSFERRIADALHGEGYALVEN